jgi:hypothetical protein
MNRRVAIKLIEIVCRNKREAERVFLVAKKGFVIDDVDLNKEE